MKREWNADVVPLTVNQRRLAQSKRRERGISIAYRGRSCALEKKQQERTSRRAGVVLILFTYYINQARPVMVEVTNLHVPRAL